MRNVGLVIVIYKSFVFLMSEEFVHTVLCYQKSNRSTSENKLNNFGNLFIGTCRAWHSNVKKYFP